MAMAIGANQHSAKITGVEQLTELGKCLELQLENGNKLGHSPGQFVAFSAFGVEEALCSISSSPAREDSFELCIKNEGDLANITNRLEPEVVVDIRGPLGNGFPMDLLKGKDVLLAVGGFGLVTARSLINCVLDNRSDYGNLTILYGCKTPDEVLFKDEIAYWEKLDDVNCQVTVNKPDRQWKRRVGIITTLFSKTTVDFKNTVAVVVGPPVMYRFVALECIQRGIPEDRILMSLEDRMDCAIDGSQDGPVFTLRQLRDLPGTGVVRR
jgi:NAD(P)H-flavin reductase